MVRISIRRGLPAVMMMAALGLFALAGGTPPADAFGIAPAMPDLKVTDAGITPLPGNKTEVWIRVRNGGSAPAPAATHILWFQGRGNTGQSTLAGGALAVGGEQNYKITLLYALPSGAYLVGGCADSLKQVNELLESNNCLSKPVNVP